MQLFISGLTMQRKKFILLVLVLIFILPASAQVRLSDDANISLITASPWYSAIYAYFGHTAIRVQDDSTGVDTVFNYGYFDTSKPGFIYDFVRGKTDYILGAVPYKYFLQEYVDNGQELVEQELNLLPAEKQQLYEALSINALPENRGYRYNYFYDNCSTRPRDMVEKYTQGVIQYPPTAQKQSYRDLVHECVGHDRWAKFGIDLLIGSYADSTINVRDKMFIPSYLMDSFEGAVIQRNDSVSEPLVKKTEILSPADPIKNAKGGHTLLVPMVAALMLIFLTLVVSFVQVVKMDVLILPRIFDTVLFAVAGLAGIILMMLIFFSVHPATSPNWNFVWLNPFAFIAAILFWMKLANKTVYIYHFINFALLTLFLLSWVFIPQQLPVVTIPFSMCLWIRSGTNIYMFRKKSLKNRQFTTSKYIKAGWGGL